MPGLLRHGQSKVNAIAAILGQSASNDLPSKPYIRVGLTKKPWAPPILERQRAIFSWEMKRGITPLRKSRRFSNILCRRRFCIAVDGVGGFDSYGGIAAQRCNLGLALHHSANDSPALAIAYDINLHTKLSRLPRGRTPNIDYTESPPKRWRAI